jgi:flavin-dependent dehydrogenase
MNNPASADTDVVILGGGLAGLTLALQLRQRDPAIAVTVLERRTGPAPDAAFKVGESTVEIGAHYFAEVLGLRAHLDAAHVRKFGFRFFFSEGQADIERCTELGVSRLLPTPSWQIDRGRFENFLASHARANGVDVREGAVVRGLALGADDEAHRVEFERHGRASTLRARWLVDASGRAGLLKRKLGLAEHIDHDVNAVWWRVDGVVDPHAWSQDPDWLARCTPPDRWRSTNHLCGAGYWVWMIPLASGAHSIGIVAEGTQHPLDTLNSHDKAMAWLRTWQPALAAALADPRHRLQDFHFLRHFSHGCRQVFSAQRWAITGEAGLFLDPFYSPGSDFIAISNDYIADLVMRERAGHACAAHAEIYGQLYRSFYDTMMTLYRGQYALFGDAQVMPVKVIWDYTFYWGLLAPLYYAGKLTDLGLLGRLRPQFADASALNEAMQLLLRAWGECNAGPMPPDGRMLDQYRIAWFHEMNRALADRLDDDALYARLSANVGRMRWLAAEILERATAAHPGIADHGLRALLADQIAPASLSPDWYAEAVA